MDAGKERCLGGLPATHLAASGGPWKRQQGDATGEGSWVFSMSVRCSSILRGFCVIDMRAAHLSLRGVLLLCAAHPSCVGFCVIVHCSSILRGVLCHCALLIHLAWGSVLLSAAHPSCVGFCVIVRCTGDLAKVWYERCVKMRGRFSQSLVLREA